MTALQLFTYIGAATALQLLLGIAVAVWRSRHRTRVLSLDVQITPLDLAWNGLRDFRVAARAFEDAAQTQCSFTLAPVDGAPLTPFKPGQFLTFSLPVAGSDAAGRVMRCYSISDTPDPDHYRITVKRAIAPPSKPDAPAGIASGWLHDHAQLGTVLQVRAPSGQFIFAPDPITPPVFIAGGIGVTPIFAMLKSALADRPDQSAHLFYGVRNGQDHAFKSVLNQLARAHPRFDMHVLYSDPGSLDAIGQDYDLQGFISLDLLKQVLPHERHAFYLCGPDPMMKALIPALKAWGVEDADIHRESFGPQTAVPKEKTSASGPVLSIGFRSSGRTLDWTGQDATLLDFAERHSVLLESGCRSGSCGTCETRLISGQVAYATKPDHTIAPGHCLPCVCTPTSTLELDA